MTAGARLVWRGDPGAYVFAAGTLRWAWGLDSYADSAHGALVNPRAADHEERAEFISQRQAGAAAPSENPLLKSFCTSRRDVIPQRLLQPTALRGRST